MCGHDLVRCVNEIVKSKEQENCGECVHTGFYTNHRTLEEKLLLICFS